MDYPKLNEKIESKKSKIDGRIKSVEAKIDSILETLGEFEVAVGDKRKVYNDFMNSKRAKTKLELGEKKKKMLDNASARVKAKNGIVEGCRAQLKKLMAEQADLEKSAEGLKGFSPVTEQASDPELLEVFEFSKNAYRKPNSVFKVFEGRFTPTKYRVMPRAEGRFATERWDRIPLDHIVVDPNLIPDWLVEEFKLAEMSDDLSEVQKLRLKAKAIPKLRELFRRVKPLNRYDGNGNTAPNFRFLAVNGLDPECDGKIIYSRSFGQSEESVDRKMIQTHENAYSALRMTGHAKQGYQAELTSLAGMEIEIESLQRQLSELRKTDKDYEAKREALKGKMGNASEWLKRSTNYFKSTAFATMHSKVNFKDSMGRENLGATCATWLKAIRILKARTPQASNRSQYGQADRHTLELLVAESEALLDIHFLEWGHVSSRLQNRGSEGNQEDLPKDLFASLESIRSLDTIQPVRPFLQYSKLLSAQKEKVVAAIENRDRDAAVLESNKAISLGAIFRAQKGIEEILRTISLNPTPNLDALEKQAVLLAEGMRLNGCFPKGSPATTLNGLVLSTLDEFKWDLGEVRKANPSVETLAKSLEPLKEKLKSLDFAFCLGSLE